MRHPAGTGLGGRSDGFLPAGLIAAVGAVWLAHDVYLLVCLWLRERVARLRAQPGGIMAFEQYEVWSDGTGRWTSMS